MYSRPTFVFCLLTSALVFSAEAESKDKRPNVLFIAVDDLRPQLGCYGHANMRTPNIDRLAAQGVTFDRAYCMVPVCGASRASLMTGLRPTRDRFVGWQAWAEKEAPGTITLNTHFKTNGYYTVSNGKVFHQLDDNAQGWSEPAWRPDDLSFYRTPENVALQTEREKKPGKRGPSTEAAELPDNVYTDGKILEKSVQDLRRLAKLDQPFFLAVGFYKPHLPFVAPKKYWDLYDRAAIQLPATYHPPQDAPKPAIHTWGELRAYSDIPTQGPVSEEKARTLIHGYYACVSFTDAQIGKLLDELTRLGLAENTIVVLWGDHGWSLGEHTLWCKHSCFETSMRIPLIVKSPQIKGGQKTMGLTESIDIYPTLSELAGLTPPSHLQGNSFVPLLKNPNQPWQEAAIGRYQDSDTIRTDQFRLTDFSEPNGKVSARMLYDHNTDPHEDVNIAKQKGQAATIAALVNQLQNSAGKAKPTAAKKNPLKK